MAGQAVHVIGAGMVGVCTALELQARGAQVTLLDRRDPGRETSWG
ncbi:MAG: FAD-dependent oxidoreductase, partial [Pseudomonadota bacterium]